tara:strand:+ start:16276 stop:16617 length:342 start_codon:yes stop_codon:yes gene_type:complete
MELDLDQPGASKTEGLPTEESSKPKEILSSPEEETPSLLIRMSSKNQPGRSTVELGSVQIRNLNWILSAVSISVKVSSVKLLSTQPLWVVEEKTGTGADAPFGTGALIAIVLG